MFRSLSDLSELNPNFQCPSTVETSDLVSFIPMGDVSDSGHWITKRTRLLNSVRQGFTPFENGDVLFAKITPCMENGKGAHVVGLTNGVGFGSTEFHVLRPKPEADARFIFHHTQHRSLRAAAEAAMTGSAGQKRVPTEFFHKWKVYAPGKEEQSRIADILDTLDTQIQKTEALIAKLEKIKEGLLHDLLTRGVDKKGQLRPSPEQAPELYKKSMLGLIPKEWDVDYLGNLSESGLLNGVFKQPSRVGSGVPLINVADLYKGSSVKLSDCEQFDASPTERSKYSAKLGDIFFTRSSLKLEGIAHCNWLKHDVEEGSVVYECHVIRIRPAPKVHPHFLVSWCQSQYARRHFMANAKQVTMTTISQDGIASLRCPVPPLLEQINAFKRIKSLEDRIESEASVLSKIRKQKTGLMDDLLTGQVLVTSLLKDEV